METKTKITFAFKVGDEYLSDVWEEWGDWKNYSFTKSLSNAMKFHFIKGSHVAPKYLWDNERGQSCDTAEDMRQMFKGDFVNVVATETWKEVVADE